MPTKLIGTELIQESWSSMGAIRDGFIGLGGITLTIFLNIATVLVHPGELERLQKDPAQFLYYTSVPFELWIVSLSLLVGAYFALQNSQDKDRIKRLVPGFIVAICALVSILVSLVFAQVMPNYYPHWSAIYVPDLLGFIFFAVATRMAREN